MSEVQPLKTKSEIDRMRQSLHGRDKLLFIVGINTNLRISDIVKLKREDFEGEHLVLVEKKTGKRKTLFINEAIQNALAEHAPTNGYLFVSRKKKDGESQPISTTQAYRILNDAAARANLTINFGTHTMRKTWAYHAYNEGKGADLSLIMKALNHSSQRETLRYIGIEREDLDNVYMNVVL